MTFQSKVEKQYAEIARAYFNYRKVYRYHMKKISDMNDSEVISKCHFWYTDHNLIDDYQAFEEGFLKDE